MVSAGIPGTFILGVLLSSGLPQTDRPKPVIQAIALQEAEEVYLDGRLSEPLWDRVVPTTNFFQKEPSEGTPATEITEVRIVYSHNNLFLGVKLYDSQPDQIIGNQKLRDGSLRGDDRFMFILDTFLDGRSAYFFETNPAGLMGDGLVQVGSGWGLNKSWDGIWEARTAKHPYGWSVEIRIPFSTLNFDPNNDTWGINFQRTIRRKQEEALWSSFGINEGLYLPVNAGHLTGLKSLSQGLGLEVKPYGAASHRTNDKINDVSTPVNVGADLNYSVTPSLRAAITLNTDFAEVEVDQRRVNLTRFPLYFPERRDFFLEGSNVYAFARANGANPFFSRRIGLVNGRPIPILFGSRLTGRVGRYDLGILQVRTGEKDNNPVEDFTVARIKRNFFSQSTIGVIYTRRGTHASPDIDVTAESHHTIGFDLDLITSNFMGDKNLQFEAFSVLHNDPVEKTADNIWDNSVRGIRINYPNERWRGHASYRQFGKHYNPAVGFVRRNGFRRFQPSFAFAPRPQNNRFVRQFEWELFFEHVTDLNGQLLTRNARIDLLDVRFNSGDEARIGFENRFELLEHPFAISDGIIIPSGTYEFNDLSLSVETASHRIISGELALTRGRFWSGESNRIDTELTLKPVSGFLIRTVWERNSISLPEGDFTTQVLRQRGEWQLSPWVSTTAIVQFDNISNVLGLFARFQWTVKPGSDLFVVYTHNWQNLSGKFFSLERAATTKINYTHRF